jgi:hypothetical protein
MSSTNPLPPRPSTAGASSSHTKFVLAPSAPSDDARVLALRKEFSRTLTLANSQTSLAHPPWLERQRAEQRLKVEKEKAAEAAAATQWVSKSKSREAEADAVDLSTANADPALAKQRLRLRLMMGQAPERATEGIPLPDVAGPANGKKGGKKGGRGGRGKGEGDGGGGEGGGGQHGDGEAAANNSAAGAPASRRQARRASLVGGQGMDAAPPRPTGGAADDDLAAATARPATATATATAAAAAPSSFRPPQRRHRTQLTPLEAAQDGEGGFTGLRLKNAPLHTRYLEDLRRQAAEAARAVRTARGDLLGRIDRLMDPAWRPPGRGKMLAAAAAAEVAAATDSPHSHHHHPHHNSHLLPT